MVIRFASCDKFEEAAIIPLISAEVLWEEAFWDEVGCHIPEEAT